MKFSIMRQEKGDLIKQVTA